MLSAFFGLKWQSSSRENELLKQRLSEKKEKLYAEWIRFYMSLMSKPNKTDKIPEEMKKLNEEILLVGSNKVLLTYGDLMQYLYQSEGDEPKQLLRLIGELIVVMREDLGHKDWMNSTFWGDAIRPWIKDASKFLPKDKKGLRRYYSKNTQPE